MDLSWLNRNLVPRIPDGPRLSHILEVESAEHQVERLPTLLAINTARNTGDKEVRLLQFPSQ
jgi:hypothetical protein